MGTIDLPTLLLSCVQEIALEGFQGCSLSTLFSRLVSNDEVVAGAYKGKFDVYVKEWIWRELRDRPEIEFVVETGPLAPPEAGEETGKKGKGKGKGASAAGAGPSAPKGPVARGKRDFACEPIQDRASLYRPVAELIPHYGDKLRMVALQSIRESALGVHDPEKPITDIQYNILEFIGRRRREGVMQMEISKVFDIEPRNLFHHLRNLESANLIVRQQIILNRAQQQAAANGGPAHFSSHTNLVHLKRFAPQGSGGASAPAPKPSGTSTGRKRKSAEEGEEEGAEGQGEEGEEEESDDDDVQEGAYVVARDPEACKEVCMMLAKTHNGVLIESDVKATLRFPGNKRKQTRSWNRIKRKLIKMGLMEMARYKLDGKKLVTCIKSLKPWTDDDAKRAQENVDDEGEKLRAEIFVEQQVLDRIDEAGPDGTTHPDLFNDLGVDQKWLYEITKKLISNYGVLAIAEKTGRQSQYRLVANRWYSDRAPQELQELVQRNMYQSWKKTRLQEELNRSAQQSAALPPPDAAALVPVPHAEVVPGYGGELPPPLPLAPPEDQAAPPIHPAPDGGGAQFFPTG